MKTKTLSLLSLAITFLAADAAAGGLADEQLRQALLKQDAVAVLIALEAGADPNLDFSGYSYALSALQVAVLGDSKPSVEHLRRYGATIKDKRSETPLHVLAANCGRYGLPDQFKPLPVERRVAWIRYFASAGITEISASTSEASCELQAGYFKRTGTTPLTLAALDGSLEVLEELLAIPGIDLDALHADTTLLMDIASMKAPKQEIVERVLQAKPNLEIADSAGRTAMHYAAASAPLWLMQKLYDGAQADPKAKSGATPLLFAALNKRADVMALLLDRGADPNASVPSERRSVLSTAIEKGMDLETVSLLLAHGAQPDLPNGLPLFHASKKGAKAIVAKLIGAGSDMSKYGGAALKEALTAGYYEIAHLLADAGTDVNQSVGSQPLLLELTPTYSPPPNLHGIVGFFIARKADLEVTDSNGMTVLLRAAERGWKDVAFALIDAGANLDVVGGGYYSTPLIEAIEGRHFEIAIKLVAAGAAVDFPVPGKALESALWENHAPLVGALLKAGADPKANSKYLLTIVERGNLEILNLFVAAGVDMHVLFDGENLINRAVRALWVDGVKRLVELGLDPTLPKDGGSSYYRFPLAEAAQKKHLELVRALLASPRIDVNQKSRDGETALFRTSTSAIIDALVDAGIAINHQGGYTNATALIGFAPAAESNDLSRKLIRRGANVNLKDQNGKTAVAHALAAKNTELVVFLCQNGAEDPICNQQRGL